MDPGSEASCATTTWLVAALGPGSLVLLIALSMLASSRKAEDIHTQLDQLNTHHQNVEARLRARRSDVHLSSILVRDYLLAVARERAPEYREQLAEFRRTNVDTLAELRPLVGRREQVASLQSKLDEYWATFDPSFDWTHRPGSADQLRATCDCRDRSGLCHGARGAVARRSRG